MPPGEGPDSPSRGPALSAPEAAPTPGRRRRGGLVDTLQLRPGAWRAGTVDEGREAGPRDPTSGRYCRLVIVSEWLAEGHGGQRGVVGNGVPLLR